MPFALHLGIKQIGGRTWAAMFWLVLCGTIVFAYGQPKPLQHTVLMEAVAFFPATLEVKVGDTVVWQNKDPFPHNATADNGQFHSGDIDPERTGEIKIDKPGRFPYVCTLHPGMRGVLIVK